MPLSFTNSRCECESYCLVDNNGLRHIPKQRRMDERLRQLQWTLREWDWIRFLLLYCSFHLLAVPWLVCNPISLIILTPFCHSPPSTHSRVLHPLFLMRDGDLLILYSNL
jgi:hypothetical protein